MPALETLGEYFFFFFFSIDQCPWTLKVCRSHAPKKSTDGRWRPNKTDTRLGKWKGWLNLVSVGLWGDNRTIINDAKYSVNFFVLSTGRDSLFTFSLTKLSRV